MLTSWALGELFTYCSSRLLPNHDDVAERKMIRAHHTSRDFMAAITSMAIDSPSKHFLVVAAPSSH